jgi:hypothetical protein
LPVATQGEHDASAFTKKLFVGPGATMSMGCITTTAGVRVGWSWEADQMLKAVAAEFTMEGVVLTRYLTPSVGDSPGSVSFAVTNPKPFDIAVTVTVIDAADRRCDVREAVPAGADDFSVGPSSADVSGKLKMRWGWKQAPK